MIRFFRYLGVLLVFSAVSCTQAPTELLNLFGLNLSTHEYSEIDENLIVDPEVEALIEKHRKGLILELQEVVTIADGDFIKSKPESAMGNLMADILRRWAMHLEGRYIDIGLVNYGGIRTNLSAGPITKGAVFEVMPFENYLTLVELSGTKVLELAAEVAARNGDMISGMRMRIVDGQAKDVIVGSGGVDASKTYWVATNSYVADGGDNYKSLQNPLQRKDLNVLIREVIIEYMKSKKSISPTIDGRIRK